MSSHCGETQDLPSDEDSMKQKAPPKQRKPCEHYRKHFYQDDYKFWYWRCEYCGHYEMDYERNNESNSTKTKERA